MTIDAAVSVTGLTKHFPGVQALTDLTLEVPAGSIYGFLGPNGAGKTTAIKMLAGLARPTRGSATVAGIPLEAGARYRRSIGYLGQEPRFYDWMTGRETLRYVASLHPSATAMDGASSDDLLRRVGLADAAERRTRTYSGGMRQRLGIAQALVGRPAVLLLDEPVSALDPIGRKEVLDLMEQLKGETTVFYSTHILDDVQRVSDHVAIVDHGRLVRAAPTAELLASFTLDRLSVGLGGATDATAVDLAALPGVRSVESGDRVGDTRSFVLRIVPDAAAAIQRAVTAYAAANDFTLTENHLVRLDLEDVFLRLVDTTEGIGVRPMTSTAALDSKARPGGDALAGLGALGRKDATEWIRGRRASIVFVMVTLFMALTAANGAIGQWLIANVPGAETGSTVPSLDPTANLMSAVSSQIFALAAVLATMGLFAIERESGTLAWTASKPVSRGAIWLSKWLTASGVLLIAAVVLPLAVTVGLVVVLYGSVAPALVIAIAVGMAASLMFIVAVVLAASTVLPSQAAVATVGLVVLAVPPILGSILPIADFLPMSILPWTVGLATAGAVGWVTPIAWLISLVALTAFAVRRLDRAEF